MGWRNRVNALVVRGGVVVWAQAACNPPRPQGMRLRRRPRRRAYSHLPWSGGRIVSLASTIVCHPGNQPGVAAAARNGAFNVLEDMGFGVPREFWPELARQLRMPFRGVREE